MSRLDPNYLCGVRLQDAMPHEYIDAPDTSCRQNEAKRSTGGWAKRFDPCGQPMNYGARETGGRNPECQCAPPRRKRSLRQQEFDEYPHTDSAKEETKGNGMSARYRTHREVCKSSLKQYNNADNHQQRREEKKRTKALCRLLAISATTHHCPRRKPTAQPIPS